LQFYYERTAGIPETPETVYEKSFTFAIKSLYEFKNNPRTEEKK